MKWVGQHIFDFLTRFRGDVYLDNVPQGVIGTAKNLGIDGDGKLVRAQVGTGNTELTEFKILDNDAAQKTIDYGTFVKFAEQGNLQIDWTGGSGTQADPYVMTFKALTPSLVAEAEGLSTTLNVGSGGTGISTLYPNRILRTHLSGQTPGFTQMHMIDPGSLVIGGNTGPQVATLSEGNNIDITVGNSSIAISALIRPVLSANVAGVISPPGQTDFDSGAKFLKSNNTWGVPDTANIPNGDKGDISVTNSGDTWTIDDNAVSFAKMQDISSSTIMGRSGIGTGDPQAMDANTVRAMLQVDQHANAYVHPDHTGEVTSTADGDTEISSNVVDEDNLKVSNNPTDSHVLSADSGESGGLKWVAQVDTQNEYSISAPSGTTNISLAGTGAAGSTTSAITLTQGGATTITRNSGTEIVISSTDTQPNPRVINDPVWAAKGDLIVGTGNDVASVLSVGTTNGHVLAIDSNEIHGVKWISAPSGETYTISTQDGDSDSEKKIRLTDSGNNHDDIIIEAGNGLTISESSDKITLTNTVYAGGYYNEWSAGADGATRNLKLVQPNGGHTAVSITAGEGISISNDTVGSISNLNISSTVTGSGVTIKDKDNNTYENITEIQHYGLDTDVKVYANGTGKVIVDHHAQLQFSDAFMQAGSTTAAMVSSVDSTSINRTIGIPGTGDNNLYYPGDWAGLKNKPTTAGNQTLTFYTQNPVSNMANNPKIEVTVYGPQDATSAGTSNILGEDGSNGYTFLYEVNSSIEGSIQSNYDNGVTVQVGYLTTDGVGSALKGTINVTIDPDHPSLITTSAGGNTYTGSQKFAKVKVRHLNNDGTQVTNSGVYESDSWFHDNNTIAPVAPTPVLTFGSNTVSRLSNIAYYSSATYNVTLTGFTNLSRDTSRYSGTGSSNSNSNSWYIIDNDFSTGLLVPPGLYDDLLTKNDKANANDDADLLVTSGATSTDTNITGVGSATWSRDAQSSLVQWSKTTDVKSKVLNVDGNYWVDGAYSSTVTDSTNRNYNTYTSGNDALSEDHKNEVYRLSPNKEDDWKILNTEETSDYWKNKCVGGQYSGTQKSLYLDPHLPNAVSFRKADIVELTNDLLPTYATAITVAGWLKMKDQHLGNSYESGMKAIFANNGAVPSSVSNNLILGMYDYDNGDFSETSESKWYWWVSYNDTYSHNNQTGTPALPPEVPANDEWFHVAYVLKHNASSNTDVEVWVNGVKVWDQEHAGEFEMKTNGKKYTLGFEYDSNHDRGDFVDCYMSEWGVWIGALSQIEIEEISRKNESVKNVLDLSNDNSNYTSSSDLRAYYKLDDDVSRNGGVITDSSGNSRHGVCTQDDSGVSGALSWVADSPFVSGSNNTDYSGWGLNSNNQHLMQGYWKLNNGVNSEQWRLRHPNMGDVTNVSIGDHPTHIWSNPGNGMFEYIRFFRHTDTGIGDDITKGSLKINALHKGSASSVTGSFLQQVAAGNLQIDLMIPGDVNADSYKGVWVPLHNSIDPGTPNYGCWKNNNDNKQAQQGNFDYDVEFQTSFRVIIVRIKFNQNFSGDIKALTWTPNVWQNE